MTSTATILAFPLGRISMQDRAEMLRWNAVSASYGWRLGGDDALTIETSSDGREHVRVTLRALTDDGVYFVSRDHGGWVVLDRRGAASVWQTLRDALESICPTMWCGAAPGRIAPTPVPA